jgi:hypothetical protein
MKKALVIGVFSIAALQQGPAWAQTGAVAWANLPSGAREAGLAGGLAALADGVQGSRLNPASLAGIKGTQAEASHDEWLQGVTQEQGAVAFNMGAGIGAALSADWLDMGEVTRYQTQANGSLAAAGSWHPTAGSASLSVGLPLGSDLAAGASVRGWRDDLDSEGAMAGSGSASLRYTPMPAWSLSASLLDVGTPLAGDPLPSTLRVGGAWSGQGGQHVAIEASSLLGSNNGVDLAAAAEMPIGKSMTVRGGGLFTAGSLQPVPTMGFSVAVSSVSLDVAYSPVGSLGSTLNAGLSWTTF